MNSHLRDLVKSIKREYPYHSVSASSEQAMQLQPIEPQLESDAGCCSGIEDETLQHSPDLVEPAHKW